MIFNDFHHFSRRPKCYVLPPIFHKINKKCSKNVICIQKSAANMFYILFCISPTIFRQTGTIQPVLWRKTYIFYIFLMIFNDFRHFSRRPKCYIVHPNFHKIQQKCTKNVICIQKTPPICFTFGFAFLLRFSGTSAPCRPLFGEKHTFSIYV